MSDKKELFEDDSALTTPDLDPDNIRVMPEAIAIASDGASWTAHIREYLTKTNFHAGKTIHPEKAEIGKAVSLDCPSTYTLNGEHIQPRDFAYSEPVIYKASKQDAKKQPNPIAQSASSLIKFKPLKIADQTNPYALKIYNTSTSDISKANRRRTDRRKPKQSFPEIINAEQNSESAVSGVLKSLSAQEHGKALPTRSTPLKNEAASDCDLINVCVLLKQKSLVTRLLRELAREPDIKAENQHIGDSTMLLAQLKQWPPKLLLLDMASYEQLGTEWLRMIRADVPVIRIILILDQVDLNAMDVIMRHRIQGCLLTNCPRDVYVKAIRTVAGGDLWLPRALLAKAYSDLLTPDSHCHEEVKDDQCSPNAMDALTKREREIVGFLSQGLSNKQIAQQLDIMEDTVKKHLQNIFRKFGVRRRTLVMLRQVAEQ